MQKDGADDPIHRAAMEMWTQTDLWAQWGKERVEQMERVALKPVPRSKRLLISWLQSPFAVILEPRKIKSDTFSTVSPSISHEVMGPDAMIFVF